MAGIEVYQQITTKSHLTEHKQRIEYAPDSTGENTHMNTAQKQREVNAVTWYD